MRINIDADPENADWTKRTPDLPTTKVELLKHLEDSGTTLQEFRALPVYRWNRAHFDRILGD